MTNVQQIIIYIVQSSDLFQGLQLQETVCNTYTIVNFYKNIKLCIIIRNII